MPLEIQLNQNYHLQFEIDLDKFLAKSFLRVARNLAVSILRSRIHSSNQIAVRLLQFHTILNITAISSEWRRRVVPRENQDHGHGKKSALDHTWRPRGPGRCHCSIHSLEYDDLAVGTEFRRLSSRTIDGGGGCPSLTLQLNFEVHNHECRSPGSHLHGQHHQPSYEHSTKPITRIRVERTPLTGSSPVSRKPCGSAITPFRLRPILWVNKIRQIQLLAAESVLRSHLFSLITLWH